MAWPTPQDYNEAVQSPQSSFSDPELKAGQVETNKLGLPRPISGRFAVVYNMRCGPRNVAVRCFQSEVPDQQERYAAISEHLKKSRLPYTVDFDFQRDGVRVGGRWYPILKMEWVGGEPLHTYVERFRCSGCSPSAVNADARFQTFLSRPRPRSSTWPSSTTTPTSISSPRSPGSAAGG